LVRRPFQETGDVRVEHATRGLQCVSIHAKIRRRGHGKRTRHRTKRIAGSHRPRERVPRFRPERQEVPHAWANEMTTPPFAPPQETIDVPPGHPHTKVTTFIGGDRRELLRPAAEVIEPKIRVLLRKESHHRTIRVVDVYRRIRHALERSGHLVFLDHPSAYLTIGQ
jgi:hypothetical protein